ncbi:hypothetical protein [Methylocapsa palsarum]|uniref:Uncharacterized protein n=1 Tax=Methylocapsa palsarum TaxID=1612308 RepID=A0A1I4BVC6_9HYPH|nr:hypothetical protein [Methylocapsa palsarum]SFK72748.1 hypothetical protein SAMN05444581_1173 [Methylocapsa palsarum]
MPNSTVPAAATGLPARSTKAKTRPRPRRRKQDDAAFIANLLEPVLPHELDDFEYNKLARKCLEDAWKDVDARTRHDRAAFEFWDKYWCYYRFHMKDKSKADYAFEQRSSWLADWRKSVAEQLRTAACDSAGLAWKRRMEKEPCLSISREEIDAAIAADEAFLAAHPVRRPSKVAKKSAISDVLG